MSEVDQSEPLLAIESLYNFNKALTELGSKQGKVNFKEIFDKNDNKFSEGIDFFKYLLNYEVFDYLKSFPGIFVEGSGNTLQIVIEKLKRKQYEEMTKFLANKHKFVSQSLIDFSPDQTDNQGVEEMKGPDKFKAKGQGEAKVETDVETDVVTVDKPKRTIFQPLDDLTVIEHMVESDFKREQKEKILKKLTLEINTELLKVFQAKTQFDKKRQFGLFKKFLNLNDNYIKIQVEETKSRFNELVDDIVKLMYDAEHLHIDMRHHLAKLFELDIDGDSCETVRVHFPFSGEAFGVTCELEHDLKRANSSFIDLEDLKDILLLIKREHLEKIFKNIIDHSKGTNVRENFISRELYENLQKLIKYKSISEENCTYFVQKIMEKENIFVTQNNKGTTKINKTIRHDGDLVSGTSIAPDIVNNSKVKLSSDADNAADHKFSMLESLTVITAKLLSFDAGNGPKFTTDRQYENRMRELKSNDTSQEDYMPDIFLTHNAIDYIRINYVSNDDTEWFRITFSCPPSLQSDRVVTNAMSNLNDLGLTFSTASITEITSIVSQVINKLAELWILKEKTKKGRMSKEQQQRQDRIIFLKFIKDSFFSNYVSNYFCTIIYLTSLIKMLGDLMTYIVVLARVIVLDDDTLDDDTEKCFMLSSNDYSLIFQALGTIRFENVHFQNKFDNSKTSAFVHIKNTDMVIPISEKEKKIYKMMMYLTASDDDSNNFNDLYNLFQLIKMSGVLPLYNKRNLKKQLSELTDILVTIRLEIDTLINNRLEIIRSQNSNTSDEDIEAIVLRDHISNNLKHYVIIVNNLIRIISNLPVKTNRIMQLNFNGIEQDHEEILTALSEKTSFKDLIINLFDVIDLFEPIAKDPYIITLINKLESYLNSMRSLYDLKEYYDNKLEKLGDLMIFLNGFDFDNIYTFDHVVDENVYVFARSLIDGVLLSKLKVSVAVASATGQSTQKKFAFEWTKGASDLINRKRPNKNLENENTDRDSFSPVPQFERGASVNSYFDQASQSSLTKNKKRNVSYRDKIKSSGENLKKYKNTNTNKTGFVNFNEHVDRDMEVTLHSGGKTLKKRRRKKKPRSSRKLKLKLKLKNKNNNKSKKSIHIPENKYKTSKKKK